MTAGYSHTKEHGEGPHGPSSAALVLPYHPLEERFSLRLAAAEDLRAFHLGLFEMAGRHNSLPPASGYIEDPQAPPRTRAFNSSRLLSRSHPHLWKYLQAEARCSFRGWTLR